MKKRKFLKFTALLMLFAFNSVCIDAECSFAPPRSKDANLGRFNKIFSTYWMDGEYNVITHNLSITFNQDLDNVEILIYKDGSVCEQEIESSVRKADFKEYLLSTYGKGNYTICVKVDGIIVASEEIVL